ncbi:class I adenylate-forming enzyme family protein [Sedimentitalea sp. JM2-8]|uniref:Class I adenylate-forming enzyme family protein n=1 Tax=Sedimentitalea xiamensis TaxID=3050037 RepID=A0ABT7FCH5_9RHOB|nr:class I adenylate-forming enzyme family protein [Sedimentitalea xiamensis]MDK3072650.1 class I adenylate-forming enzyme family protein [Sedimentitalea xiamensis]
MVDMVTAVPPMTPEAAVQHVTTTNPLFELTTATIRGTQFRVFKNIPPHARALLHASRAAQADGAADYLVFQDDRWTFDEFTNEVHRMAHVLERDFAVTKGIPVAIAMRNYPELLILVLAIASIGAVTVFVNAWWTTEELDYALRDSDARLVFADKDRVERIQPLVADLGLTLVGVRDGEGLAGKSYSDLLAACADTTAPDVEIDTDDDFAVMYSSGTTGHPKGVVQTHRGAMNAVFTWLMQAVMAPLVNPPEDDAPPAPRPSVLIVTPLFHVTATHPMFLLSMPAGAKLALMYKWDATEAVRIVEKEKITRFLGVPTQSAELLQASEALGFSLETLDYIGSGGAKRPAAQVEDLARKFPNADIATGWGMTETNAVGIGMAGPDYVARPGSAGRLHPPVQDLKFLDENGHEVPTGEIGEITVKSPCNMRCYLNKPEATAEVLRDGWLRTGDMGFIDSDGYVTISDRKKNIIIRGGENISCLDVEGALHRHPAVAEACAFSLPHDRLGETVGACVQTRPGQSTSQEELNAFLADHIARFKIPERIWIQASPLPRGATDKTDRRALRAQCLESIAETGAV